MLKLLLPLVLATLISACSERSAETVPILPGVSLALAEQRAAVLSNLEYKLRFDIPAEQAAAIMGWAEIDFRLGSIDSPLQLDFRAAPANVISVLANGSVVSATIENEHIVVPAEYLLPGDNRIAIEFVAGDTSLNRNPDYLYTLFVPDRARTAFPLFDQPDLKAIYDLTLTVPDHWVAMSNAAVDSIQDVASGLEYRFQKSDRISSYLFSFVAGEFETLERTINGRKMTMLHRETDDAKVARNVDEIFDLHAASLEWLEDYTDIDYPYQKFGFALIPAFQYGGMEHVGAIQYRAASLFLDESPSESQLLGRAGLIAHETAHMWFGNLVTMQWFNDVWTKEVFANFMAAKIVNPSFPTIDHDLNFLVRHYPRAYSVDRTSGANPIRQDLQNLNEAGQMYGAIIYNKAPIMMRQLEKMLGEAPFREGMQEYLASYSFANATWPALIEILDRKSTDDLLQWSEVWVNTPGRPRIEAQFNDAGDALLQIDSSGLQRVWPQAFAITSLSEEFGDERFAVLSNAASVAIDNIRVPPAADVIFNSDGMGYGVFPTTFGVLQHWGRLIDVEKGATLINLYEDLLDQGSVATVDYYHALVNIVVAEENQLVLSLALRQLETIYWKLLPQSTRQQVSGDLEAKLWQTMVQQSDSSRKKIFFAAFANIATSLDQVMKVSDVWSGALKIDGLPLSETDYIALAQTLAIKIPDDADDIVEQQLARTENPDNRRKLEFIAPSLSADADRRAQFVESLVQEENRAVESWVLEALENIHHPLRIESAEKLILQSLQLLQEIQVTGDIFFPKRWLDVTLGNHRSGTAVHTVETFLNERPDYNEQLKMKILQSADMLFRANSLTSADRVQ